VLCCACTKVSDASRARNAKTVLFMISPLV
jgi:hypothetical protein